MHRKQLEPATKNTTLKKWLHSDFSPRDEHGSCRSWSLINTRWYFHLIKKEERRTTKNFSFVNVCGCLFSTGFCSHKSLKFTGGSPAMVGIAVMTTCSIGSWKKNLFVWRTKALIQTNQAQTSSILQECCQLRDFYVFTNIFQYNSWCKWQNDN